VGGFEALLSDQTDFHGGAGVYHQVPCVNFQPLSSAICAAVMAAVAEST
jgi:hypothetical protein